MDKHEKSVSEQRRVHYRKLPIKKMCKKNKLSRPETIRLRKSAFKTGPWLACGNSGSQTVPSLLWWTRWFTVPRLYKQFSLCLTPAFLLKIWDFVTCKTENTYKSLIKTLGTKFLMGFLVQKYRMCVAAFSLLREVYALCDHSWEGECIRKSTHGFF